MKSKLFKRIAASFLAAALTAAPLVTLAETAAPAIGRAFAAVTRTAEQPTKNIKVPDGYNEHDYLKLRTFFETEDEEGVKNGEKMSEYYNPDNPGTWSGEDPDDPKVWIEYVIWIDTDSGKRVEEVNFDHWFFSIEFHFCGKLDLSGCTALTKIDCDANPLTELDVSGCTALVKLDCSSNQLTELNVSGCTALEELNCSSNELTSLDVSSNAALATLWCYWNQLISLDVSNNAALTKLDCGSNQLTSLDVSSNAALATLWCYWNQLISLDVSNNAALEDLDCGSNQLTELDVSKNIALTGLRCASNQLNKLDLSNNPELKYLDCSGNKFTELDLSKNTALVKLCCYDNQLTELDVGGCTALETLECCGNKLTKLDLKNCEIPYLTSAASEGNGWVGCDYRYSGIDERYFLVANPMPGCTFEGWYSPNGQLLSTEQSLVYYKGEPDYKVWIYTSFFDTTDFIAKFSGEPIENPGDVDGDGETTVKDALSAIRSAMTLLNLTDEQIAVADMDGDGRVTVGDALAILRAAMGLMKP